jgi:hypothetical protein
LFVGEGITLQGEKAPGYAPSVAAQLGLTPGKVYTRLIPIGYETFCISRIDRYPDFIELSPVSVTILNGSQRTVEQCVSLAGVQHLSLDYAHDPSRPETCAGQ